MKNRPFITGIIAAVTPFPLLAFTALWCWIWGLGIGLGLLGYDRIPDWIGVVGTLPLLISPMLGLLGLVHSIIKIKTKLSWLGIVLSVLCSLENLMICGIFYLASRF